MGERCLQKVCPQTADTWGKTRATWARKAGKACGSDSPAQSEAPPRLTLDLTFRLPGVNPADITAILICLKVQGAKRQEKEEDASEMKCGDTE